VLATHQHQYVHDCRCAFVSRGRVLCVGSYEDCIRASNGQLKAHQADDAVDNVDQEPYEPTMSDDKNVVFVDEKVQDETFGDASQDNKELNVQVRTFYVGIS